MNRNQWVMLGLFVCIALFLISGSVIWYSGIVAKRELKQATEALEAARSNISALQARITTSEHAPSYLANISTKEVESSLAKAEASLKKADGGKRPKQVIHSSREARDQVNLATKGITKCSKELDLLDTALVTYKQEITNASKLIAQAKKQRDSLTQIGYFSSHFEECNRLLASASTLLTESQAKANTKIDQRWPDYRASYLLSLESQQQSRRATESAKSVDQMRHENIRRCQEAQSALDRVLPALASAENDANYLYRYPRYRHWLQEVSRERQRSNVCYELLRQANRQNSMKVQHFSLASNELSDAESRLNSLQQLSNDISRQRREVENVVADLDNARSDAERAVSKAASHISFYSENSQYQAKSHLTDARDKLREADDCSSNDPVQSLSLYHEAGNAADEAYSAVDTFDHSSSDDSSSSSSYGGSSSSSSSSYDSGNSGGSSSSYGGSSNSGSGYSSPSGGGYSSSPSGGDFGGPSGGDFGGPSGGDFGSR